MKRQKFYPDNRHNIYHTCTPTIRTSQSYRGNPMGHAHSIREEYNRDHGYYTPSGHRGYNKQRDYIARNEHYTRSDYARTHNNLASRPAVSPRYYYKSPTKADYYQPSVSHYYSEPSLTDVTSYHDSEISYRGSLVSVASSLDDLHDRIQTHKAKQQQHHGRVYPHSDNEGRHSRHVHSLYSSDDQNKRHTDVEREIYQRKDMRLNRKRTDETFSESRTKNNRNNPTNNQALSYSVYNARMNANDSGNNNVPLMMFRKDETEGSSNSDVVYIPVVILPDKNTANGSNTESERVDNEQAFTKRKYLVQHNVAHDTIIENDETLSDIPDPYTNIVYRKVNDENLFKENECSLLNNTTGMKRIQDMNAFDEKLYKMKPTVNDNNKKTSNIETMINKHFSPFNGTEIEQLQGIITHNDKDKIPKSDHLNIPVMVAGFNTITNPFSNPAENMKPKLTPSSSRFGGGTSRKKSVVQHSQSVQVSQKCVTTKKDGEVQVSDLPSVIITKDGNVQTSEVDIPTMTPINEGLMSNKLKGEKPGIISDDILSPPLSKDGKVKKMKSAKANSENTTKEGKSGSEGKYKEIVHEINDLVNKVSREENQPNQKSSEEYNCCQRRVCKKESNNSRQSKYKLNNEKNQFPPKNLLTKSDYKDMPKNMNSSYFQQESCESPFQRLFSNDYKMTSRPPYFPVGMYTDNPMGMENTYKWLTEPNRGFIESTSSSFRTIPKRTKNVQTAYPFFTKLKKKIFSRDKLVDKKDAKETTKREDTIEEEEEEKIQEQDLAAAGKISEQKIRNEGIKEPEKRVETKPKQQIEVNLSFLWDYIIQGFNMYLGKTVHTVLIDGIYTFGTVTEKLQNRRN